MLVRSAGRRQRRNTARILATSFAQLDLPWLAPAQLRWSATHTTAAATCQSSPKSKRRIASPTAPAPAPVPVHAQTRKLATATEQHNAEQSPSSPYNSAAGYSNTFRSYVQDRNSAVDWSKHVGTMPNSALRPYEDPIMLKEANSVKPQHVYVAAGMTGTVIELLQHLATSLHVGRMSRAEAIIQRLGEACALDSPELIHAHMAYLEESLRKIGMQGRTIESRETAERMHEWFEKEIRDKGVAVDAKMLIIMIRATIRAFGAGRRGRAIRDMVEMGRGLGDDFQEVLQSEEYDDHEFLVLTQAAAAEYADEVATAEEAATDDAVDVDSPVVSADAQTEEGPAVLAADEIPDVRETQQQGDSLNAIKRTMKTFMDSRDVSDDLSPESRQAKLIEREHVLEQAGVEIAVERWRAADKELKKIGINTAMQQKSTAGLMWQWQQALLPALEQELADCRKLLDDPDKQTDNDRLHYGPYLELLNLDRLAANIIIFAVTTFTSGRKDRPDETLSLKLSSLIMKLAHNIEQEAKIELSTKDTRMPQFQGTYDGKRITRKMMKLRGVARETRVSKKEQERRLLLSRLEWPTVVKVKLGAMLMSKLIETAQLPVTRTHPRTKEPVTQLQPAFLHRWTYNQGKRHGVLSPNPTLLAKLHSEPLGALIAKRMPMIVEPKPWTGWNKGGYLDYTDRILRIAPGDNGAREYFMAAHAKGDMKQLYAAVTALGKVPWRVHHGVLKTQVEAWNTGEAIANFAPMDPGITVPPEPERFAPQDKRKKWMTEVKEAQNKRAGLHSKRCFQNFQLEIAKAMVNETMYFPHNLDFRGRAYPIPPYLNHMGADNVRGLLIFADGKELGSKGLRWLKIHLATVAGHDKASMEQRVAFTMEHIDDIYDSVRNPLGGRRWWLQAEDAWQTLAACHELVEALDSPDPTKFVSHLPIQQDGTCNGLQHYAALGGDQAGAEQVNLEPGDRPADVYTAVAEAVKEQVRNDAAKGHPVAKVLDGRLTRKSVKQPVMTNVYGVTYYGAREQVQKQLEVMFPEKTMFDEVNFQRMAGYVVDKIFKSLGSMFSGAQAIQDWFGICADRIACSLTPEQIAEMSVAKPNMIPKDARMTKARKLAEIEARDPSNPRQNDPTTSRGSTYSDRRLLSTSKPLFKSTVVWTTPLRLPVVQPYRTTDRELVHTLMQSIALRNPHKWQPVSRRKQLQAFPPNFIHSLDATHMLLSVMKCTEEGMTFASIHDSFWTHACDVDSMSVILRDAFVAMHKDNIVGRLREEFQARYKGCMYLQGIVAHSSVGKKIMELRKDKKMDADIKTQMVGMTELAREVERLRLIESEDPEERARGEAITTPGSLVANEAEPGAFDFTAEIAQQQLGRIPLLAQHTTANNEADVVAASTDGEDVEPAAAAEADGEMGVDADAEAKPAKAEKEPYKKPKYVRKLWVWMPLTFPEIPAKGSFDVEKLKQSTYFFH